MLCKSKFSSLTDDNQLLPYLILTPVVHVYKTVQSIQSYTRLKLWGIKTIMKQHLTSFVTTRAN